MAPEATNLSISYELMRGLPQGSNESPVVFDVFIEDLIHELRRYKAGVLVKARRISSLLFADDIVLIAGTEASLRLALVVVDIFLRKWRLIANPSPKFAFMVVNKIRWQQREPLRIGTHCLRCVDTYSYLGVKLQAAK